MNILKLFFTSLPASNSATGSINANDYVKILRLALTAGVGYALTVLVQSLSGMDFGDYQQVVQIGLTVLTEVARRLLSTKPADPAVLPANPV